MFSPSIALPAAPPGALPSTTRDLRRMSLLELRKSAHSSGAVARFTQQMGGPPDLVHADAEDLIEFIRENAP
jgi:hypothetical protein